MGGLEGSLQASNPGSPLDCRELKAPFESHALRLDLRLPDDPVGFVAMTMSGMAKGTARRSPDRVLLPSSGVAANNARASFT